MVKLIHRIGCFLFGKLASNESGRILQIKLEKCGELHKLCWKNVYVCA